jgi:hypothetical protein
MPAEETPKYSLRHVIVGSVFTSVASLGLLYAGKIAPQSGSMLDLAFMVSGLFAIGWLGLFLYAIVKFGKRGLWVLLGGVPALWVMFIFLAIPFACAFQHNCL